MKREILCMSCGYESRIQFPTMNPYPDEYVKHLGGSAKKDFVCDSCNADILKGSRCVARSMWHTLKGLPYYDWETKYLEA